jgi:hypothetical protein
MPAALVRPGRVGCCAPAPPPTATTAAHSLRGRLAAPRAVEVASSSSAPPATTSQPYFTAAGVAPPSNSAHSHFLHIDDWSRERLDAVLETAKTVKAKLAARDETYKPFAGKTMSMIFTKPSMRTRVSFETVSWWWWVGGRGAAWHAKREERRRAALARRAQKLGARGERFALPRLCAAPLATRSHARQVSALGSLPLSGTADGGDGGRHPRLSRSRFLGVGVRPFFRFPPP